MWQICSNSKSLIFRKTEDKNIQLAHLRAHAATKEKEENNIFIISK